MKFFLLMMIVGICAIGVRSPDIMRSIGLANAAQDPAAISAKSISLSASASALMQQRKPMTADEFAALSRTDSHAYQKYINSYQVEEERSQVDKLMNFFARGRFE